MRRIVIAVLLGAAASAASGETPYAPQDFDFSGLDEVLDRMACGVVESVREVKLGEAPPGLADLFEHAVRPETTEEIFVQLDDGRSVRVRQNSVAPFQPGERVRLFHDAGSMRVEHR